MIFSRTKDTISESAQCYQHRADSNQTQTCLGGPRMAEQTLFNSVPPVKRRGRYGPDNNFWKGGRSVASNGYVLVRVGTGHHLADVRGYAYEHRLVAENKIGRRLVPGEEVHHVNKNKQDNRPENLSVEKDSHHHHVKHRHPASNRRLPDQPNPFVFCNCGCGHQFEKFDSNGRPRSFVSGHNTQEAPTIAAVSAVLAGGPTHRNMIAEFLGVKVRAVATTLSNVRCRGITVKKGCGVWVLRENR